MADVSGNAGRGRPTKTYPDLMGEVLQKGRVRSTRNWRACMTRCMNVEEAKRVCKNRSRWRAVDSAYPHGKKKTRRLINDISISVPFLNYFGVSFQSNRLQLNTSVLHGATAYLTSTTQLVGNTIPLVKTGNYIYFPIIDFNH